jgi:16S rRNA processing protein RimM
MQLVVGRVTRPHGVRGEVSVEVRTDDPDLRFAVGRVMATDPAAAGPLTVESVRWHSGRLLIRFDGIADRNQAEELRGTWLTLDSAEVGSTGDPDEFHDHELIGLAVVTTSGEPVGRVTDVRHFGQDLLVIEPAPAGSGPGAGSAEAGSAEAGSAVAGSAVAGPAVAEPAVAEPEAGPVPTGPVQAGRGPGGPVLAAWVRAGPGLGSELLVPFVAAIVAEVDVAAGRLVIDPPPGLLELGTGEPGS